MAAAGITEDYRTMAAQGKLLDWTMYNGQWLGIVQPTTQAAFKAITDPSQAAYAFERNYERPANTHPERQGWAVNWYNKFKDLEISSGGGGSILSTAKSLLGYFHYSMPLRTQFGSVENPDRNGYADCSSFVWLVLTKAGYRTPPGVGWYTGSMTSDARGARNWLTEIPQSQGKAGDVLIVNQGGGAGSNGHTAILAEDWHGYTTSIIEMGGMQSGGVGVGRVDMSFGWLLNGGDVCIARAKK
jgi:cell wall-associated NlpC family hydrolase